jgi:hypothetical protein
MDTTWGMGHRDTTFLKDYRIQHGCDTIYEIHIDKHKTQILNQERNPHFKS